MSNTPSCLKEVPRGYIHGHRISPLVAYAPLPKIDIMQRQCYSLGIKYRVPGGQAVLRKAGESVGAADHRYDSKYQYLVPPPRRMPGVQGFRGGTGFKRVQGEAGLDG